VQSEPRSDVAPGTCVATVRKGYLWRGRVLRFAQVKVSTAPAAATERDPVVPSAAEPAPQGPGSGA
jgi:hypothetical protein